MMYNASCSNFATDDRRIKMKKIIAGVALIAIATSAYAWCQTVCQMVPNQATGRYEQVCWVECR